MFFNSEDVSEIEKWEKFRPELFNELEYNYLNSKEESDKELIKNSFNLFLKYLWINTNVYILTEHEMRHVISKIYKNVIDEFNNIKDVFNGEKEDLDYLINLHILLMQNAIEIYFTRNELEQILDVKHKEVVDLELSSSMKMAINSGIGLTTSLVCKSLLSEYLKNYSIDTQFTMQIFMTLVAAKISSSIITNYLTSETENKKNKFIEESADAGHHTKRLLALLDRSKALEELIKYEITEEHKQEIYPHSNLKLA